MEAIPATAAQTAYLLQLRELWSYQSHGELIAGRRLHDAVGDLGAADPDAADAVRRHTAYNATLTHGLHAAQRDPGYRALDRAARKALARRLADERYNAIITALTCDLSTLTKADASAAITALKER